MTFYRGQIHISILLLALALQSCDFIPTHSAAIQISSSTSQSQSSLQSQASDFSAKFSKCMASCQTGQSGQSQCICSTQADSACLSALPSAITSVLPKTAPDQIIQRSNTSAALSLNLQNLPSCVSSAQVLLTDSQAGSTPKWVATIDRSKAQSSTVNVPAANTKYTLSILLQDRSGNAIAAKTSASFMVGDVYIALGQSNSSSHSDVETQANTEFVKTLDVTQGQWLSIRDPMPYASSWNVLPWNSPNAAHIPSGSPWPKFASVLNQELGVPVGVVSIGWGGTGIYDWKKGKWVYDGSAGQHGCHDQTSDGLIGNIGCYPRLPATVNALGGCRFKALLWHQGESDVGNPNLCKGLTAETIGGVSYSGTSNCYAQRLAQIIRDFRADTGCMQPWLSARATHTAQTGSDGKLLDSSTAWSNEVALRNSQTELWNSGTALRGPDTDLLIGYYRYDDVHFSGSAKACTSPTPYFHYLFSQGFKNGLAIHGKLWAYYVLKDLFPSVSPSTLGDENAMISELADVRSLTISLLGRSAAETDEDVEGLRYWTGQEQTGVSRDSIIQAISSSDEAFINLQYKLYLSRNATMPEKRPCTSALASGKLSRNQVSAQIQACGTQGRCTSICQ